MSPTGNWLQHGRRIDPPLGYQIEDYFRDGRYLGPDVYGIAPELSHLVHSDADLEDLRRDAAQIVRQEAKP